MAKDDEPGVGGEGRVLTGKAMTSEPGHGAQHGAQYEAEREAEREARAWSGEQKDVLRQQAIRRLKKRRDFYGHVLVYLLVNAFLVVIWAVTDSSGFFWPVFPIVGWGIAVVLNAWDVYRREGFTEEQIRRQVRHLHGSH